MIILDHDNKSKIVICDNCLIKTNRISHYFSNQIRYSVGGTLQLCKLCITSPNPSIRVYFSPIHVLKWYSILYEYKEKGYKIISEVRL